MMKDKINKILAILTIFLIGFVKTNAQNISTIAGTGTLGYSGDGVLATSAQLDSPFGVYVDTSGNVYIADDGNHVIRKISASTGIISTIAGGGTSGLGDGGAATSAQLYAPKGVFVDSSGNVYIAEAGNNRIRKVNSSNGIISTIAGNGTFGSSGDGGVATNAQLKSPYGIFVDASSNVYIADDNNYRIRKVSASTGIISTIAGNGTYGYSGDGGVATNAQMKSPRGVFVDASGNVYIADYLNGIRKVSASTGIISTIAGNGTVGYSGDGGAATSAQLQGSTGVFVDASGNIYIAEHLNNIIRKVTVTTGIISTIAGTGIAGYSGDGGLATSAELQRPNGVFVDAGGNVYIADTLNNRIRKVTASLGLDDFSSLENNTFNFYPNPVNNRSVIEFDLIEPKEVSMAIIDLTGKIIKNISKESYNTGNHKMEMDLSELKSGFYFIRFRTKDKVIDKKLIKL